MRLLLSALVFGFLTLGFSQAPLPNAPGTVTGTVADSAGVPVPGVTVELRVGTRVERTTSTDARGTFRFDRVAPGTYGVRAVAARLGAASTIVMVADRPLSPIRLVLRPASVADQEAQMSTTAARPRAAAPPPPSAPARVLSEARV